MKPTSITYSRLKAGLHGLVIMAEMEPPVPIPNTEVKRSSANGTTS